MLKKIAYIVSCISIPFLLWMAFAFSAGRKDLVCKEISIQIDAKKDTRFVDEKYIGDKLKGETRFGHLRGKRFREFEPFELEKFLDQDPFIAKAEVYTTFNGVLGIDIEQKNALMRVEPFGKPAYYIDEVGETFSLSDQFSPDVIIATGHIDTSMRIKLYTLARFVHENPFWNAQIQQIFVGTDRSIIIIPTVGRHQVIFGKVERVEEKFENLHQFYLQVLNRKGWQHYREIDLRFENQIVCR